MTLTIKSQWYISKQPFVGVSKKTHKDTDEITLIVIDSATLSLVPTVRVIQRNDEFRVFFSVIVSYWFASKFPEYLTTLHCKLKIMVTYS